MATLLQWRGAGEARRCDSRCHFAVGDICQCLCGGVYHGAALDEGGLEEQIEKHAEDVFQKARVRWPEVEDFQHDPQPEEEKQRSLWDTPVRRKTAWDVRVNKPKRW